MNELEQWKIGKEKQKERHKQMRTIMDIITKEENVDTIMKIAKVKGINDKDSEISINLLKRSGLIYHPRTNKLKITEY